MAVHYRAQLKTWSFLPFLRAVPAFLCSAFIGGCATPVVTANGYFGVGLFVVDTERYDHEVVRTTITGVGVLTGYNSIAIGYSDRDVLVVPVEGRHYHVRTPIADWYVGDKAVAAAAQWVKEEAYESPSRAGSCSDGILSWMWRC